MACRSSLSVDPIRVSPLIANWSGPRLIAAISESQPATSNVGCSARSIFRSRSASTCAASDFAGGCFTHLSIADRSRATDDSEIGVFLSSRACQRFNSAAAVVSAGMAFSDFTSSGTLSPEAASPFAAAESSVETTAFSAAKTPSAGPSIATGNATPNPSSKASNATLAETLRRFDRLLSTATSRPSRDDLRAIASPHD